MAWSRSWYALAAPLVITAPAQAQAPAVAPPDLAFDAHRLPDARRVLALLDYTAARQIAELRARPMTVKGDVVQQLTANWISAAFLTALTRLTRVSDASDGSAFLRDTAEHFNFALRGGSSGYAMLDADNLALGETYQELFARSGFDGEIAATRQRLDYALPYLALEPAPKRLTWWWCDALFMAPPVFARMSVLTGDPSYLRAMDTQWWRTHERLWAPAEGLYLRDERFATRHAKNGKRVFWSRGNGWVVGGIARVLESMPADFPSRPRYVETLRTMAASLARLQRADGLWPANLLDPEDPPGGETSGSAFFVYGMAWGINHGLLDRKTYLPVVLRGWAGLTRAIQPDGLLGHVQLPGDQPWPTRAEDHALYGTGGLILAGLEVMRLGGPTTPLPLAEPPRAAPAAAARAPAPPPGPITPERQASLDRRTAELTAVSELGFDPARDAPGAGTPPLAPRGDGIVNPRLAQPMVPPPPEQRAAQARVRFAPYRFDDILWENDRTAHRIYGPALQAEEPPSTSGIDAWGKLVRWPFMERQLATGKQHDFHGEGIDFYNVNTFRGAGGLGIWQDHKLWVSRNWARYRILKDGPDVADFAVDYAPWPVDTARKVWETRRFTLPLGTNFTRMVSTIASDRPEPLLVGIGIQKRPTAPAAASFTADRATGRFSFWGPTDPDKGAMAVALMVDPAMIADVTEDADNYLVILKVAPGRPFVYYMGAAWSKGLDFHDRAAWERYVRGQAPSFAIPK